MNTEFNNSINKRFFSKDEFLAIRNININFLKNCLYVTFFISLNRKLLPFFIIWFID